MKTKKQNQWIHAGLDITFMIIGCVIFACIVLGGCSSLLDYHFRDTLTKMEGSEIVEGIQDPVTVRRDNLGIPFIEASNMDDLAFAMGYVSASDRLSQMIGFKLMAQGRLSEMIGPEGLDIDVYMRSHNLNKVAQNLFDTSSERSKHIMKQYSAGVNAYIEKHLDNLPPGLQLSGYSPEKWKPMDSVSVFTVIALGLSFNLQEEINTLNIIQAIGAEKAAWLSPIYPDEPLPFNEARKLAGIDLEKTAEGLTEVLSSQQHVSEMGMLGMPASNNWAISKGHTANGASVFANDTHLPIALPSMWMMMHARCPDYDAAGVAVPGVPGIVGGYNGHIAWGMTMVMADNQDIYLEDLKLIDKKLHYLYKGKWLPTTERKEIFHVKGGDVVSRIIHETRHGPLLNDVLKGVRKNELVAMAVDLPYGIAVSWTAFEPDNTMEAFYDVAQAGSVEEASELIKQIRAIPLNMVFADHDNIAWQVTGRFPLRKNGRGLMPSPGWTGEYDWVGYLDMAEHPNVLNPPENFIATANNRKVPADFPHTLSSSWFYPERGERIEQLIQATDQHTLKTDAKMQLDVHSLFVPKLKHAILKGDFYERVKNEIKEWNDEEKKGKATEALAMLDGLSGDMRAESQDACIVGALLYAYTHNTFFDELGSKDGSAWVSFLENSNMSYSAQVDHLIVRGDESPFWDDVNTPQKENKAQIIARSLADAVDLLEEHLGENRANWQWGNLHTYTWATEATKLAKHLDFFERTGMRFLAGYFNRGPFPAGGDHTTLNVAAYHIAKDFDVWLIPEMRIIVDFGLEEPMIGINSTGQSDNPVSPYYDDGIHEWLEGRYQPFPFRQVNIEHQYKGVLVLNPAGS